jgi:hypothetical protein
VKARDTIRREANRLREERPKTTRLEGSYFIRMGAALALEWVLREGDLTPSRQIEMFNAIERRGRRAALAATKGEG